ncbi:peptidase C39 (plasmid) [Streptococcus equinus]|nr:peptidase C39 [Streptococcus equinus]
MFQKGVLKVRKITPIEQTTPTECGLCCLYMMLDYFDISETYFKLKQQVNLGRNGLSIKNISDIASIYGVTCKTYRFSKYPENLPVMVFVSDSHFVILEDIRNDVFTIVDPAVGKYVLAKNEFFELSPKFYTEFFYDKVTNSSKKIVKRGLVGRNVKEMIFVNRKDIFLTILYTLIFQIITVSIPFFIRGIIDGNWVFLKKFGYLESAVLLSIIIFFQGGFYFLKNISLVKLQNKFHSTISEKFVTKLLKLPIEYIGKIDKTDIIHRYNGLMIVRELLSERIISIWLDIILMFASISYITYVSIPILLILLFLYYSPNSGSGELILLYMMVLNFINPINNILNSIDEILYGVKHYERVLEISTLDNETNGTYKLSEDTDIEINLKNINYQYELNGAKVLNGINLKVHSGEFVAIIGKSGSGKTTLAKMLLGYVSPSSGDITYNNISFSKIDKKDFRNISAFVSQDSPMFDGDVMYNISLGRESVSGEQVIETCKRVSIYDDIRSMPMKFHTLLFRDNPSISGGQKQRISLARELVTTPRILVLDEPTSALDVKTERIIQKNVEALHCTRVLVTHRLNTVEKADKILIMDNGKIIDYGNHYYLYKNNKYYCDLYDSYMNKYQEEEVK